MFFFCTILNTALFFLDDLALGKVTFSSGVKNFSTQANFLARDTTSCFSSADISNAWLAVDLEDFYSIILVDIFPNLESKNFTSLQIKTSTQSPAFNWRLAETNICNTYNGVMSDIYYTTILCTDPTIVGQFVILHSTYDRLEFCELEIFGNFHSSSGKILNTKRINYLSSFLCNIEFKNIAHNKWSWMEVSNFPKFEGIPFDYTATGYFPTTYPIYSKKDKQPWLCVDLEKYFKVSHIGVIVMGDEKCI